MKLPEFLLSNIAAIESLIAAFAGVILGFFLNTIKSAILKPKLRVYYDHSFQATDAIKLPYIDPRTGKLKQNAAIYYFRLRVKNEGKTAAKSVEVYAASLEKKSNGGIFKIRTFIPMNLTWSHGKSLHPAGDRLIYFPSISPEMEKYCDIGHIKQPKLRSADHTSHLHIKPDETDFQFDLMVVKPDSLRHVITKGEYRFKIIVAAVNAKPKEVTLRISLSGKWFEDENEMLTKGIVLKLI